MLRSGLLCRFVNRCSMHLLEIRRSLLQIIAAAADVEQKKEIYVPYNILPLDAAGASQAVMQLDEVHV